MKKKKLTGLSLNKKTISNLKKEGIKGGRSRNAICYPTTISNIQNNCDGTEWKCQ